ncbi:MAG: hypothetical protein E7423_02980 [Ruminococcaceae bacterium]|nr:hypothetical protein [Oscillospiraceae bacterium]
MFKRASERERQTGMRQSTGMMILKIVIGLVMIAAAADMDIETDWAGMFVGFILGFGMVWWGLAPKLRAKKHKAELERADEIAFQREQAAAERADIHEEKRRQWEAYLNKPRVCPACGATTKGMVCEYCGTSLMTDAEQK